MIKRTKYEYDIRHTGDEMNRMEILMAFHRLGDMVEEAALATVMIDSVKGDLITVTIETVDAP